MGADAYQRRFETAAAMLWSSRRRAGMSAGTTQSVERCRVLVTAFRSNKFHSTRVYTLRRIARDLPLWVTTEPRGWAIELRASRTLS